MKKVIFVALATLCFATVASAQCSDCAVKQQSQQQPVFTPVLCEPIAIGSYARRVGYIKEVPSGLLPIQTLCYLYLQGADGKVYEKAYPMQIITTLSNPADWFTGTNPAAPNQYLLPRAIPLTIQVKAITDANGRPVVNTDGTIAVHYDITF